MKAKEVDYIPMNRWGKDHWSTLAYLETLAVDNRGVIDNKRMRCNPRIHRELANISISGVMDGGKYPTRLKDGEIDKHDDWSCVEDIEHAGLITTSVKVTKRGMLFGNYQARIKMTKLGLSISGMLRNHKASGGNFHEFNPTV